MSARSHTRSARNARLAIRKRRDARMRKLLRRAKRRKIEMR